MGGSPSDLRDIELYPMFLTDIEAYDWMPRYGYWNVSPFILSYCKKSTKSERRKIGFGFVLEFVLELELLLCIAMTTVLHCRNL